MPALLLAAGFSPRKIARGLLVWSRFSNWILAGCKVFSRNLVYIPSTTTGNGFSLEGLRASLGKAWQDSTGVNLKPSPLRYEQTFKSEHLLGRPATRKIQHGTM